MAFDTLPIEGAAQDTHFLVIWSESERQLYASEINSVPRKKTLAVIFKANEVWEMSLRIPYWLIR